MTFKDYFSGHAADYATYRPHYPKALFQWLAQQCQGHDLAWDCATGNGQAAIALTPYFQNVIATDGSANQIQQAQAHSQVTYRVALADQSGLEPQTVDLITVAQAVHWFNLELFYAEVMRVLKPKGCLALWCYGLPTLNNAPLDEQLSHYYGITIGPFWPPERKIVEAGYRTLPFPFEPLPTPNFTMQVQWTLAQFLGYLYTWSGTQRYMAHHQSNPLEPLTADFAAQWGEEAQTIAWPISLRVGQRPD